MHLQLISVPYRYDEHNEGLGLGPAALLRAGLERKLSAQTLSAGPPMEAHLDPAAREEGNTAVNIGKLGASTAKLVATARRAGSAPLVLAGDDTAALGIAAGLQHADGANAPIGIVWLDAHGDFNTPETSYSGILAGMPLAIIAGLSGSHWRTAAGLHAPIATGRMLIAGVRELDEKEQSLLLSTAVRIVPAAEFRAGERFADAVTELANACSSLLLHIDLDVLDPHLVPSSSTPSAGGLEIDEAVAAIVTTVQTGKVAVISVCGLNPGGGQRGERSLQSALSLLEQSIPHWQTTPGVDAR